MSGRALLLGARSAIAQALAVRLAGDGWDLVLAARRCSRLEPLASDLRLRWQRQVDLLEFDALDLETHAGLADRVRDGAGPFDLVVCVFGYSGDPGETRRDTEEMTATLTTNFTAAAVCLGHLANDLEARRQGGLIAVSSVAGDRGRQSNYVYGASKGGLTVFLQGLRNRLAPAGVHVMTVKPGFVDTPMDRGPRGDVPRGLAGAGGRRHPARLAAAAERGLHALVLALDPASDSPRAGRALQAPEALTRGHPPKKPVQAPVCIMALI